MKPLDLLVLTLATFYMAHALSAAHGPWHIFERARAGLPLGGLTSCLVCLSPWFAALGWLLLMTAAAPVVWLFAASGASVLLWRFTGADRV